MSKLLGLGLSDTEVPFEVDGELAGVTPVEFVPCDKQLTVFVP